MPNWRICSFHRELVGANVDIDEVLRGHGSIQCGQSDQRTQFINVEITQLPSKIAQAAVEGADSLATAKKDALALEAKMCKAIIELSATTFQQNGIKVSQDGSSLKF